MLNCHPFDWLAGSTDQSAITSTPSPPALEGSRRRLTRRLLDEPESLELSWTARQLLQDQDYEVGG